MSLEPAVAALAGVLVLGQPVRLVVALAVVMVIIASLGTTLEAARQRGRHAAELPEGEALIGQ